jgi:hypothetical protein
MCDCTRGLDWWFAFIEHLQIVTTSNYSPIANSHTIQLTTTHTKSSQFFYSRFLVTDPNSVLCLCPYWLLDVSQLTKFRVPELLYDWRFIANQFVLAPSPLRLTSSNLFFQLNICGHSPYATSSLTREWVCSLKLLLAFASAVILRSESRGTHDHILLSQVFVFITPRKRVDRLYPRHWVPSSSPLTTRRATVEVLNPASTRDQLTHWTESEFYVTTDGQSASLS